MYIVKNDIIPFPGYKAVTIWPFIFCRKELDNVDLNHENIHGKQQLELLIIPFFLIYVIEWLIRLFFSKDRFTHQAYRNISFEREAYTNQEDMNYIEWRRKPYAWIWYIKKNQ